VKKVIELIRVSTSEQAADDRASIPAQRAVNRKTAAAYDLTIIKSVELSDVSGTAVLRTPEMQDLLRLIESPDIKGVVVREFSRVMRPDNFGDYVLFQVFQDTGTLLYLPDGPLDFNSKTGKLVAGLRAIISGNELSEIRERIWTAKEEMRRDGKCVNGDITLPFGVGYSKEQGFFYKPEAEMIRDAYRRLLAGETSYTELAKPLGFSPQAMHRLFTNPIYAGWRVYDKKRNMASSAKRYAAGGRQGDRPKILREADEVIRVKVIPDPLVTDEEFQRVQEIVALKNTHHWRHRAGVKHHFTYNGFLFCGECGTTLYGRDACGSKARRHRNPAFYYVCRRRFMGSHEKDGKCWTPYMKRDQLEGKLDGIFTDRLTNREFLTERLRELDAKSETDTSRTRIARLQAEITNLRGKRARVLDAFFEAVLTKAERDERLAEIDVRIKGTEELLLREAPVQKVSLRSLMTAFAPLFDWRFMNRESKRRILAVTVPEIRVKNYQVEGVAVTSPNLCGDHETRIQAGFDLATGSPARLWLPLNL
jgi:DNA invertase Pin-like site-specific DNA recombinase